MDDVANSADAQPDDFDGQHSDGFVVDPVGEPLVTMPYNVPEGANVEVMENQGLTEKDLPPMPNSPSGAMPTFTPADDQKLAEVQHQIAKMQYRHQQISQSGAHDFGPPRIDITTFVRAQALYIREMMLFWANSGKNTVTDQMYIDMLLRKTNEQDRFIHAQMELLHQLGVV